MKSCVGTHLFSNNLLEWTSYRTRASTCTAVPSSSFVKTGRRTGVPHWKLFIRCWSKIFTRLVAKVVCVSSMSLSNSASMGSIMVLIYVQSASCTVFLLEIDQKGVEGFRRVKGATSPSAIPLKYVGDACFCFCNFLFRVISRVK